VWGNLRTDITEGTIPKALTITLRRAFLGYALAVVIGVVLGAIISRVRILRVAVGSMITGLQTMPSIAWFPLGVLLFKGGENAIYFVVVLGAAPAIANGLISGTDNIQPILLRAGRVLGATKFSLYRHVILPASLPSFIGGLKQGWAFAWRSLMAGEIIVIVASQPSIGVLMQNARDLGDTSELMATMVVVFVIGLVVDSVFFGTIERAMRKRWGLLDTAG
jgi:NitT/TauT family transport system permease protein